MFVQQAIADSQNKLSQLRKKHTALMEKYTDLEMEYESVKSQLEALQGDSLRNGHSYIHDENESYSLSSRNLSMSGALGTRDGTYCPHLRL